MAFRDLKRVEYEEAHCMLRLETMGRELELSTVESV